ncbi:hypothetical protein RSOL_455550 [Rhizoctonia solani AG-3 Rhs1AP]|uniref:Uncharacterized protein n=1 Tax=Rhizoctonia solani AG-3 Rhs1AP TaxID=1086054 RepID=X8JIM3_9AGAM|nr:hypothetical protein RSOL_455550 [Rhizoctonia solani AG-3 Rhs1AP]
MASIPTNTTLEQSKESGSIEDIDLNLRFLWQDPIRLDSVLQAEDPRPQAVDHFVQIRPKAVPGSSFDSELQPAPVRPKDQKVPTIFKHREHEKHSYKEIFAFDHQRTQSRKLQAPAPRKCLDGHCIHMDSLRGIVQQHTEQLQQGQALKRELASLRHQLALEDEDESWVIVKRFGAINKKVDDIASHFSEILSVSNAVMGLSTLDLLRQLLGLQGYSLHSMAYFTTGDLIEAREFIELGCQSLLNGLLFKTVLDRQTFNPEWDASTNRLFYQMYQAVQEQEDQLNAGRWRVTTFKTIPNEATQFCETHAKLFCDAILVPFGRAVYDAEACVRAAHTIFPDIVALLNQAYAWNYNARSAVVTLDFEALYFSPGDSFDRSYSKLEGPEAETSTSERVLFTRQLGLVSCKALNNGKGERVCQTHALVVGSGYFGDK